MTVLLKSKQPLNDDEIDIGIGRISPGMRSSDSEIDEFCSLRRLAKRRSSPIKRLLQDVDGCLLGLFETI